MFTWIEVIPSPTLLEICPNSIKFQKLDAAPPCSGNCILMTIACAFSTFLWVPTPVDTSAVLAFLAFRSPSPVQTLYNLSLRLAWIKTNYTNFTEQSQKTLFRGSFFVPTSSEVLFSFKLWPRRLGPSLPGYSRIKSGVMERIKH